MLYPQQYRSAMLDISVKAAHAGHDLTEFMPVFDADGNPDGYEAHCKTCGATARVSQDGQLTALLEENCEPALG